MGESSGGWSSGINGGANDLAAVIDAKGYGGGGVRSVDCSVDTIVEQKSLGRRDIAAEVHDEPRSTSLSRGGCRLRLSPRQHSNGQSERGKNYTGDDAHHPTMADACAV